MREVRRHLSPVRKLMATDKEPFCCNLECENTPRWEIWWGTAPDDYTHACVDHVGELLEDGTVNHVYPLPTPGQVSQ